MPQTSEIRNVAEKWIEKYHDDALAQVQQRLDELKDAGADDAYEIWLRIYNEAESLLRAKRQSH